MLPSISIITALYNREKYITRCLNSVFQQKFPAELIVIDGGSTDESVNIIKYHLEKINFFLSEPDDGIYDAINKGVKKSCGEIIGILHSDDVFASDNILHEVANFFEKNPSIDILIGNAVFVDSNDSKKILRNYKSSRFKLFSMRFGFMPCHTATFIRRKVFIDYGLYDISFKSAGDFEFFLRVLFISKVKYFIMNKTFVIMQTGGMSTSGIRSYIRSSREISNSLKKNKIFSNMFLIMLRLPIKFIFHLIDRVFSK
jgi:glycosyltransferase involved in cell wall biosynthesis